MRAGVFAARFHWSHRRRRAAGSCPGAVIVCPTRGPLSAGSACSPWSPWPSRAGLEDAEPPAGGPYGSGSASPRRPRRPSRDWPSRRDVRAVALLRWWRRSAPAPVRVPVEHVSSWPSSAVPRERSLQFRRSRRRLLLTPLRRPLVAVPRRRVLTACVGRGRLLDVLAAATGVTVNQPERSPP